MVAYRLSGKNADRTRSCPAQPLQCLSAHPARLRLMHLHTPVYSIHTAACRIRLLVSLILLTRLVEGYPEFHCSLFAPMESKVRALTEWSTELVDAAFALRGFARFRDAFFGRRLSSTAPLEAAARGLLINVEQKKKMRGKKAAQPC
jgi:hypothetical protein